MVRGQGNEQGEFDSVLKLTTRMTGDDSMNPPPDVRMKHELEGAQEKLFGIRPSQGPNKMLNDPQNYTSRRISNANTERRRRRKESKGQYREQ